MKKSLLSLLLLLSFLSISAQVQTQAPFSEICGSDAMARQLLQDPVYQAKMNAFEANLNNDANRSAASAATYIIPVVIHVMHKGEAVGNGTNISDEAILAKIKSINDEYRKVSNTLGDGSGVDTGIEFALAVKDPTGNCTNGIDRVNMTSYATYMSNGVRLNSLSGMTDTQLKAVAFWDSNNYYNIWVISCFDNITNGTGTLGYAQLAAAHGTAIDGAVLVSHSFRDTGSKSESHELGHALNLYHTFEGDGTGNTCPVVNGCGSGSGDCCADTPPHKRSVNPCNTSGTNSCDGNSSNLLFAKNYMDYSSNECRNMFTANQKTRMVSALTTTRASYLSANGNDKLVPTAAPTAGFLQDVQSVCVGGTVTFSDKSACIPNTFQNDDTWAGISFNWTLTNGATVLTSTLQNPTFTLTVPGFYNLTYMVTNSFGSNTLNVNDAVVAGSVIIPACSPTSQYEGFYGSSLSEVAFNNIHNYTAVMTNVPYHDYSCTKNTVVNSGQTYPLKIAFKSGNTYTQAMEAYIDYNNNGLFESGELVQSGNINPGVFSYTSVDVAIPVTAVKNTLLRMRVISEAAGISEAERTCSSQYFTSDVEDYGVYITEALGVANFQNQQLHYYPNPVNDVLNIASADVIEKIAVYNLLGQLVLEMPVNRANPSVNFSGFTNGVYLVTVFGKDKKATFKVIKQ